MDPVEKLVRKKFGMTTGYDGAQESKRRRRPATRLVSEDDLLPASQRNRLVSSTQDIRRNFTIAGFAIRKHLDYVASFTFQSRNGNEKLDRRVEELIRWYSRPANCDTSGRHSLGRLVRLAEECALLDGDVFAMKMSTGHIQPIEGDRVRTPQGGLPPGMRTDEFVHGVQRDAKGKPRAYIICKRDTRGGGGFRFERIVKAGHLTQHGYFDRFDQIRGISPLAAAINAFRDLYEGFDYALAKMKVAQLFGLTFYREAAEGLTPDDDVVGTPDASGKEREPYEVDFGKGPFILDLEEGDKAAFLENKTPSTEFTAFAQIAIAAALKGLDIPYSFYDESFTNYSGSRQALLMYEQSAAEKRKNLGIWLDSITAWRLGLMIADGELELPRGMLLGDLLWEWIPIGIPWIDPYKEVRADVEALKAKLTSRRRILRRRGQDFDEVLRELAEEDKAMEKAGLTTPAADAPPAQTADGLGLAQEVALELADLLEGKRGGRA